ncbi:hypothetical protein ACFQZC_23670 [Streptacidiphilus monticola]
MLTSWTLGASYLAWETAVSPVPGGMEEQQRQVMRLSDGAVRSLPQLPLFYAGATTYSVTDGRITAADAWTQQPAAVPKALAAAFHMNGTISYRAVDGTFGWGEGNSSATGGPATQNVWDSASATLTEVRASPGDFVRGVDPLGDGYALASFAVKGHQEAAQTWLIDLRSHGYAPLTDQQAGSLSSPDRVIPLTQLSRLPGCGS